MKLEFSGHIFYGKYSNIKFYEYPSSGEPSYSMGTDGQTDMTKLIVAFSIFRTRLKSEFCHWSNRRYV